MSAVSLTLGGTSTPPRPLEQSSGNAGAEQGAGEQQLVKQQRDQDAARAQQLDAQLGQILDHQTTSNATANANANVQAIDATLSAAVSNARAAASIAVANSSEARTATPHAEGEGGTIGLQDAANQVAGARASISAAKVAALRESQHGDLADLVQLDQQAANAQGAIVINLLV